MGVDCDFLSNINRWLLNKSTDHPLRKVGDGPDCYYTTDGEKVVAQPHVNLKADTTYFGES